MNALHALPLILFGLLLILGSGCARHGKGVTTTNDLAPALEKAGRYVSWAAQLADPQGFVDTGVDKCDATLFSCLAMLGGAKVNYASAESLAEPGRWFRDSARSCSAAAGNTASGFSRDMAIGLALCLWQADDTGGARAFLAYTNAHGGSMAPDGDQAIAAAQPLVEYLFRTIIAKADSAPLPAHPGDPDPGNPTGEPPAQTLGASFLVGPAAHITMLGILLDGLMHGGLLPVELDLVKRQASRQPGNALYQAVLHKYTDGNQTVALNLLADKQWFPDGRLPASSDRAADYLWQRDEPGNDWLPDTKTAPPAVFSGTDYTFVVALISGAFRESK